jgi:tetratricopeptide (TPR) repeat protein
MSFLVRASFLFVALSAVLLAGNGCRRIISSEEKQLRADLRHTLRTRDFAAATSLARRVVRLAPADDGAWARLAQAQLGAEDLTGAKQTLEEWAGAIRQPSAKLAEDRGDIAFAEDDRMEALRNWNMAAAGRGKTTRAIEKVARLYQEDAAWEKSAAAWTRAIHIRDNASARANRALCFHRLRNWDAALADVHRARELAPDEAQVRKATALFDRLAKFLPEVRDLDRELAAMPRDATLLADRALLFLRAEDPDLALDDARAAATLAPAAARPKLFQALALSALRREGEARKLQVRTPVPPDALSPQFLETISRLDAEISAEPQSAELRVTRAWQLNEISQPALALQDAEEALRLDPKSAGAYAESGYSLAQLERGLEAFERVKKATELDANFSTAWQYRGELEMRRSDFLSAIEAFTRALAINQTAGALEKREECYRRVGLLAKAAEDRAQLEQFRAKK